MPQICQYCSTVYTPRRKGGRFCSTTCRVSAWDKAQQSEEAQWLYQGEEVYLAHKIDSLGKQASQLLPQLSTTMTPDQVQQIRTLLDRLQHERDNSIVQRLVQARPVAPGGTSVSH